MLTERRWARSHSMNAETELLNDVALMFFDTMSVGCVASDYARSVIKMVAEAILMNKVKMIATDGKVCLNMGDVALAIMNPEQAFGFAGDLIELAKSAKAQERAKDGRAETKDAGSGTKGENQTTGVSDNKTL
jgi:hypothetical protein